VIVTAKLPWILQSDGGREMDVSLGQQFVQCKAAKAQRRQEESNTLRPCGIASLRFLAVRREFDSRAPPLGVAPLASVWHHSESDGSS
jgi:hypothetical protein